MIIHNYTFDQIDVGDILCMDGKPVWMVEEKDDIKKTIGRLNIVDKQLNPTYEYASGSPFTECRILDFADALYKKFTTWKERYE